MYNFKENFPNYDVTPDGKIFKEWKEIIPFKSNKYLQVLLFDKDHKRCLFGVHTVVAMKYLENFFVGCVVHHKDGNQHNNSLDNLEVLSREEHSRLHGVGNMNLANYVKEYGPANKGKKMSKEFCRKCSESAKHRVLISPCKFNGNQFVDKFGNRRHKKPFTIVPFKFINK